MAPVPALLPAQPPLPASHACEELLAGFLDGPCRVGAAVLSTFDGRLVAVANRISFDHARIAAISGSVLALAEAFSRELGQPICRYAIVDSGHGLTIVLRVATPAGGWVLTTIGASDTSLGLLFTHSRQLAERLGLLAGRADAQLPLPAHPPT